MHFKEPLGIFQESVLAGFGAKEIDLTLVLNPWIICWVAGDDALAHCFFRR
jgi:hypothetical protein